MKILITGANGQLGSEFVKQAQYAGYDILATDVQDMDITDIQEVKKTFSDFLPQLVVNAAAYTLVDKAQTEQEICYAINAQGPGNLALVCAKSHLPLIHISTDYVFDGTKGSAYIESDPIAPLDVYGKTKAQGEKNIWSQLNQHIILRTSWLYSVHGTNFVKTMLKLGKKNKQVSVVADQYGSPTSASDLAQAVLDIADFIKKRNALQWGIYHYSGLGVTTWYEFAKNIFEIAGKCSPLAVSEILPVTTHEYPTPAKRPVFSALDSGRIKQKFNISPKPWRKSLETTIHRILKRQI
jgi:dTDP-4-dehydrorhamnose reductase